ncbi:MAG: helix-turn-helix domain-containing protein [Oscillospiraceae bacterium]|nr:helix-turn-helix domain-containing protein [Oscillospiraceae bacterium]
MAASLENGGYMNYITQLNGFFGYLDRKITLTANAVSLYVMLLSINNKEDWIAEFSIKNSYFEDRMGLKRDKLNEARNLLKQKGLIRYQSADGSASGVYSIIEFTKEGTLISDTQTATQSDTQNPPQPDTQSATQTGSLPININKPKHKTKTISKKFAPPRLDEVREYCLSRGNDIDPVYFFNFYSAADWHDSNGKPVKNWKQKIITWEGSARSGKYRNNFNPAAEQKSFSEIAAELEERSGVI